jgi:phospholipase/carboxylesterase
MENYRAGGRAILPVVDELAAEDGLDRDEIILMGFSQGAAISFALAGLGMLVPRAIICLAGFLPQGDLSLFAGLPVFWGHGTQDELVPAERARMDVERLHKAGADVTYCEADVDHRLGIECTRGLKGWLKTLLKGEPGS